MTRIVKDPTERKNEILDAAEELFMAKGYDATSVKDIISKVGVAHGLFYYYFSSKEDVLNAVVERYWDAISKELMTIAHDKDIGPVEKIEKIFLQGVLMKEKKMNILSNVVKSENPLLINKVIKYGIDMFVPILAIPVKEGVELGIFEVEYPEYVLEMHFIGTSYSLDIESLKEGIEPYRTKLLLMFDMLERMLGAKKGTFYNIKDIIIKMTDDILDKYYKDFIKK